MTTDTSTYEPGQDNLRPPQSKRRRLARRLLVVVLSLLGSCLLLFKSEAGPRVAVLLATNGCEGWALMLCRGIEGTNLGMPLGFKAHRLEAVLLRTAALLDRSRAPEALEAIERYRANAEGANCPSEVLRAVSHRASLYADEERWEEAAALLLTELRRHPEQPRPESYLSEVIGWLSEAGENAKALAVFEEYARGHKQSEDAMLAVDAVWQAFEDSHREPEGREYLLRVQAEHKGQPLDKAIADTLSESKSPLPPIGK
ncbi:MAG: hypothetical protein ABFE16_10835 [Armatimonadia bacterium]